MEDTLVTIIMPVYNAELYLRDAIESVLAQSYKKFIFMIINDGSTDQSETIILEYKDERIQYISNEENLGIVKTLNKGIALSHTKYISRMDADDICDPKRLERQISVMEKDSQITLLGTWAELIDEKGKAVGKLTPYTDDKSIRTALLFSNIFVHSSVMIRRCILEKNHWKYEENHKAVEDYGLWTKISNQYKVEILPEMLLKYRLNTNGIMSNENKNITGMLKNRSVIYEYLLSEMKIDVSNKGIFDYTVFVNGYTEVIDLQYIIKLLSKIRFKILIEDTYDVNLFDNFVSGLYRGYSYHNNISIYEFYKYLLENYIWKNPKVLKETVKYFMTKMKNRVKG